MLANINKIEQMIQMKIDENNDINKKVRDIIDAFDHAAIVSITDQSGKITYINDLFIKLSMYSATELIGKTHEVVNSDVHSLEYVKELRNTITSGNTWRGEICNRKKDASLYWVDVTICPLLDQEGKVYRYISISNEVTAKKKMEEGFIGNAEMVKFITENMYDLIAVLDKEANFKYTSASHEKLLGFNLSKLSKSNFYSIVLDEDRETLESKIKSAYKVDSNLKPEPFEFRIRNAKGEVHFVEATINQVNQVEKYNGDIVLVMRDITKRKESERMIRNLAYFDQLTNLLNRVSFRKQLYKDTEKARKNNENLGFVYFNIDRLRYVNDSLGHEAGDYVLSIVADRLKEILHSNSTIGRIAGDEFAFIIKDIDDADEAVKIAQKAQVYIEEPIQVDGQSYILSTSCGISLFPEHAQSPSDLVIKAEKALQNVKTRGGAGYELYEYGSVEKTLERILLENEMRKSIKLRYFYLDYQPKVDLITGQWVGLEALVRWNHQDLGLIRPDKFIPVAEETKLILPLGEWILREACEQIKKWEEKNIALRVAVNISAVQLEEPTFLEVVQTILRETGVSPKFIEFELTESAIGDRKDMKDKLLEIRSYGITISIDDFGTGYSTFSYIKDIPADILKIDISFIHDIHINEESQAIVKAIISLAKTVGLRVIAEGIEQQEQADILLALGCDEGQGYYYSRPIPPEACEQYMKQ